ncbi:mRNA binding protein puf3 [Friedmanniomyces endolithicus]|nr:mRNA binding protein puf3 [Friedmanniomyces endolithicus]
MAWTANSASIWGSGGLPNTFVSRATTRDNSGSRDVVPRPVSARAEEFEGKSGSGSLVDGSFSMHSWDSRTPYGVKRTLPSDRALSKTGFPDGTSSQQRSFSTTSASQSLSGASQNFPFASRPQPVSLNPSATQPRPAYATTLSSSQSRGIDQPPTVYTKFDRPANPAKAADSAIGNGTSSFWPGTMNNVSPTDERWPRYSAQNRNDSLFASREVSQPPSRQSEVQPSFSQTDYSRSTARTTPTNSRTQSITSHSNGEYPSYMNYGSEHLGMQFGQLSMNGNSRPPTSYKPTMPSNGFSNHGSSVNSNFSFARSHVNGASRSYDPVEDIEEIDRSIMHNLGLDAYVSPQSSTVYPGYSRSGSGNRSMPDTQINDLRNAQPFRLSSQARAHDSNGGFRPGASEFRSYTNGLAPGDKRTPSVVPYPQLYIDPHFQQFIAQQMQRDPYAQIYNPYMLQDALQNQSYYPLLNPLTGVDPYASSGDMPPEEGVQSALMYEFKSNTKTKRYELKDIYDHIAEFAGDQHGSRFIQTKLETANSDEKERVFREIEPNAIQLMTDVFGNYVIQKFFEHGDQTHKKILANNMRGRVLDLSLQMYGCRVVQKALDHVLVDQQALLIRELEEHVVRCVKDQNGNHVIQKAIERCPPHTIAFIFEAFRGQVASLSIHSFGCRVIQRCLEHCEMPAKNQVLKELLELQGIPTMISNEYGNYVVQHIVAKDTGHGKLRVLDTVLQGLEGFSKHKFASNVVEKCLEQADDTWRRRVIYKLADLSQHRRMEGGEDVIVGLIRDNYGNYVIQKLLDMLCAADFNNFIDLLQPAMTQAKRAGAGKQTQSIEKKMDRYMRPPHRHANVFGVGITNGTNNGITNSNPAFNKPSYPPAAHHQHSHHLQHPHQHNQHNQQANHQFHLAPPSGPRSPFPSPFTSSAANTPPPPSSLATGGQSLLGSGWQSLNGDAVEGAAAVVERGGGRIGSGGGGGGLVR